MNIHIGSEKVRKFLRHVRHYYPFSIAGTLVILACLYLIGSAFATSNPYAFLLGAMTIIVLVLLAIMGRIQANKAERARIEWDASAPVYAREKNTHHKLVVRGLKLLPFYRLHFRLSGTFSVGRNRTLFMTIWEIDISTMVLKEERKHANGTVPVVCTTTSNFV